MSKGVLRRVYAIGGLDRRLYSTPPAWQVGTFEQDSESEGLLTLRFTGIESEEALTRARADSDVIAEQYRLAIAKRTGCPLRMTLKHSSEPILDKPGKVRLSTTFAITVTAAGAILPRAPPSEIEQLPKDTARWIQTLTEAHHFQSYPDEVLKRFYLLIEELEEEFGSCLDATQREEVRELKWLRHFVSHPRCDGREVYAFIEAQLPSAVVSEEPPRVRFDRTSVEHRNLIGRYEPIARALAGRLLDAAIEKLPTPEKGLKLRCFM